MSAASPSKLRQTVEEIRENPPPGSSTNLDDMPITPRDPDDTSSSPPQQQRSNKQVEFGDNPLENSDFNSTGSGSPKDQPRREETNLKTVMDFVSKITTSAAKQPRKSLEVILDSLGYQKDLGEDSSDDESDSSDSKSLSSISFSFGGSSDGSSLFGPLKNLNSILHRFSSEVAHRSWVENNPHLL